MKLKEIRLYWVKASFTSFRKADTVVALHFSATVVSESVAA